MITAAEVAQGTYGAWRLARGDADGLKYFGDTQEAFWRSFYAALIVAPAFAILVLLRLDETPVESGVLRILLIESLTYVIGWVAFPLVMIAVADYLDRWPNYYRFIVAYNWSAVLQTLLYLMVTVVTHGGGLSRGVAAVVGLATMGIIFLYQWYIARVALDAGGGAAAGIVFLDLMIGIFINILSTGAL